MKQRIAALFTGQGAQKIGMGKSFFEASEVAQELFKTADKTLGFKLSELCFKGPIEELTLTANAQPALLLTSFIAFKLSGIQPLAGAGHSLGEYSALVAAGSLKFEDAINLVHKRGRYMQEAVPAGTGKMIAVMGPEEVELQELINQVTNSRTGVIVEIANLNTPGQTVLSGNNSGIDDFLKLAGEKKIKVIPLNVSAPFHCSLMQSAADKLAIDLELTEFRDPEWVIYSNVTAQAVKTGVTARELLKKQVCGSVRWFESVRNMLQENNIEVTIEFGASDVLTKMQKRINDTVEKYVVSDMQQLQALI
ncbi:MAG: ACP S-malonyltransferase [Deltaproteobacteria bacterium]|jgi:[acyl-carrier-protein] S-malonyltransferase|nr:ACP S-malonyltransferase [Deltaproteobacteria bacterium]